MAHWLEAALFSLEEVGMRVQIPPWQLPVFFFLSSFFNPLAFYFLLETFRFEDEDDYEYEI